MEHPHYTKNECREMVPSWLAVMDSNAQALHAAARAGDWAEFHKQAVNLKWDSTNLAGLGLDMVHHTKVPA